MLNLLRKLKRQKSFSLKAEGESMLPLLHPHDIGFYKKISFNKIGTNDIVFAGRKNQFFTHRVIYKARDYLVTKGDNNPIADGKISPQHIFGKLTQVRRRGRLIDPEMLYLIQSTFYFQEIIKIKNALIKNQIDYVFLKGLPVHLYFENSHPRRLYQDADVLINREDYLKAKKILLKSGYQLAYSSLFLEKNQEEETNKQETSFFKLVNGFPVVFDVHLEPVFMMTQFGHLDALYPQRLIDQLGREFLQTKKEIIINNEKFFILNSKFLIIYLALHFFHHNFRGAFRLELLDKVIRKLKLNNKDWINIRTKINQFHLNNFVYPVFYLSRKYYQTPFPDFMNFRNFIDFKNLDIFSDEFRLESGMNRFKNLFFLSPLPWYKKIFIFGNSSVWQHGYFTLKSKLKNLLQKN